MNRSRILTALSLSAMAFALAACGGGGGGGGSSSGSGSGSGGTTTGSTTDAASLLAAYTVPAAIQAEKTLNYPTPFNASNTFLESNCQNAGTASTTVYVGPNTLVYATTGVSDKAQALAADYAEQGIAAVKAYFGLNTSSIGYDGVNKVQVCVDNTLGSSVGDDTTGVSGQGTYNALDVMSEDSVNFAARYPGATSLNSPVGTSYLDLYRHELTHAYHDTVLGTVAAGSLERWFAEGLATSVSQLPVPAKATVLGYVASADLIVANTAASQDMSVYPAYEETMQMILNPAPGFGNGVQSIPTFLAAYKAAAINLCAAPIPSGLTEPSYLTDGMPAGDYNTCYQPNGLTDPRLEAVFDATFNATFKNANGTPLLLHTADGSGSLEANLATMLNAYMQ